jgi:hypothetical protein
MRRTLIAGLALALAADSSFSSLSRPGFREPLQGLESLSRMPYERAEPLVRAPRLIGYLLQAGIGLDLSRDFRLQGIEAPEVRGFGILDDNGEYMASVAGPVGCTTLFDAWKVPPAERPATGTSQCLLFKYRQRCLDEDPAMDAWLVFHLPSGMFLLGTVTHPCPDFSPAEKVRLFRAYDAALRAIEEQMLAGCPPVPH